MLISLIVAMAQNRVIGRDGRLPWRLPEDLRHFQQLTLGHTLLMGRATFDSIGGPLPGRTSCLLSRTCSSPLQGCAVYPDLAEALAAIAASGETELFICGGAEVYHAALPCCERIYLSELERTVEGDRFFPEIPADQFSLVRKVRFCAAESWTFSILQRKQLG